MQKATAREITEGLKPIKEGIENLPQAIQPLGEASGEASKKEKQLSPIKIAKKLKDIAYSVEEVIDRPTHDEVYGIYNKEGFPYIGNK